MRKRRPTTTVLQDVKRTHDELEALRRQQAATQAKLIRACLDAINQTSAQAQRRLERERRNHPNPNKRVVRMHEPALKVRNDKLLAMLHLEALATMLEKQSEGLT